MPPSSHSAFFFFSLSPLCTPLVYTPWGASSHHLSGHFGEREGKGAWGRDLLGAHLQAAVGAGGGKRRAPSQVSRGGATRYVAQRGQAARAQDLQAPLARSRSGSALARLPPSQVTPGARVLTAVLAVLVVRGSAGAQSLRRSSPARVRGRSPRACSRDIRGEMEVADYQARIFALEQALAVERSRHVDHLREIAAAAGLREAQAAGLLASRGSAITPSGGGPGPSPTESEGSTTGRAPPHGAGEPARAAGKSKTELWLERTKRATAGSAAGSTASSATSSATSASATPPSVGAHSDVSAAPAPGKMGRWMKRVKGGPAAGGSPPLSKLDRWLQRQGKPPASSGSAPSPPVWAEGNGASGAMPDVSMEEEKRLLARITDAWSKLDGVMELVADLQCRRAGPADDKSGSQGKGLCDKCGAQQGGAPESPSASATPEAWASGSGSGTQMGLRMEEKIRGLTVTHVVPGGQADQAGLEVKDVIKHVNGNKVSSLKVFGKLCQHSGEVVMLDVSRGTGSAHKSITLYSRTRPPSPPRDEGPEDADKLEERMQLMTSASGRAAMQEELAEAFNKSRAASASAAVQGPGAGHVMAKKKKNIVYNKYGKDTQLWVPDSDESSALVDSVPSKGKAGVVEAGGFFIYPPGHPDYVPLPPGEAALIAGRQHIHAEERLAPHWSNVIFKSPTGAEIRAAARHATYGTIAKVSGALVNADPITAHVDLKNAHEIQGCVAYIKRGGAPFTKKARVAVAAGACACVVANHDKETFGMSYTDDGQPFEALNIPCVMISADIAEKLESSNNWQVTLTPAKSENSSRKPPSPPQHQGNPDQPSTPSAQAPPGSSPPGGSPAADGAAKANGLRGLEVCVRALGCRRGGLTCVCVCVRVRVSLCVCVCILEVCMHRCLV